MLKNLALVDRTVVIAVYLLVAVVTYGNVAARLTHGCDKVTGNGDCYFGATLGGLGAGALWYIYWPLRGSYLAWGGE